MILNKKFNTEKPILQSLFEFADENKNDLPDRWFAQACREYEVDEQSIMEQMLASREYRFSRYSTGWSVWERN